MKLKVWAGNAGEQGLSTIVAATSQRQAVELLNRVLPGKFRVSMYEFRGWWARSEHAENLAFATSAGVWQRASYGSKFERLVGR